MNIKITTQMVSNRQKKKRLFVSAFVMTLFMALFTQVANARVYMHDGSSYVGNSGVKFYDSGGPSKGPANYWLHWFGRNQTFTYTFQPETSGYAIQVDFEEFSAYTDNNGTNDPHELHAPNGEDIAQFSLRLNDAELYVYEGTEVNANNLITTLTGTIYEAFTIMANGPITFQFKSYGYTEEGWGATVKQIPAADYKLQKPAISMAVCSDEVVLYPTILGAEIHYTLDGSNPTANTGTVYSNPFTLTAYPTTVKAVTVKGSNSSTLVADKTYTSDYATPIPNVNLATIVRDGNTIIINPGAVPDHLNETYGIIYTYAVNGGTPDDPVYLGLNNPDNIGTYVAPDGWNGSMPGLVHFDWTTPNTNFKFCVVAQTCGKQSAVQTYSFGKLQVPDPELTISDNGDNTGAADITWESGYVIRYTTDGSNPTTTNGTLVSSGTSVSVSPLAPGTNVKVVAYKLTNGAVDANYDLSHVINEMYLPGGGNSGTYGGIVILNDFEDHSWSYYSDATSPIKSLNPADVKITYFGNSPAGRTTMTTDSESGNNPTSFSATATGVKVNIDADEDQFIYLKTLEKDGDSYPYTMIPNPFQVRPKYDGSGGGGGSSFSYSQNFESGNDWTFVQNTTNYWTRGTAAHSGGNYGLYITNGSTNNYTTNTSAVSYAYKEFTLEAGTYTINFDWRAYGETSNYGSTIYDYLRVLLAPANVTLKANTLFDGLTYNSVPNGWIALDGGALYNTTSWGSKSSEFNITNAGSYKVIFVWRNDGSSGTQPPAAIDNISITQGSSGGSASEWRGFYAWRIKSLSSGLTISGKSVGGIVYADEEITFETDNAEGNEVEFEALWAQAYVTTGTSDMTTYVSNGTGDYAKYQNACERNFHVITSSTTASNLQKSYPLTISSRYPDGSNGGGSLSAGDFTAAADTKFENISVGTSTSNTYTAANHDLIFGRGVTGSIYRVQGLNSAPSGTNTNAQYTMRLESGTFTYVSWIKGYWYTANNNYSGSMTINGSNNSIVGVLGCDYDRAYASANPNATSGGNNNLTVTGPVFYGFSSAMPNQDVSKKSLDVTVKSGKFNTTLGTNMGTADAHECIYMGIAGASTNTGERKLTIEGGVLANVAGGVDAGDCEGNRTFTLRMRKGTVNGAIYGAGAVSPAYGDRYMVITGGTVKGWIGGGCNGVIGSGTTGGQTMGKSHVYVGGNVSVGGSATINGSEGGTVFGAGKGSGNADEEPESGRMSDGTNVVIADEATISNNVYGGGNYGFADEYTKMYVLGGTVQGSVFGGSNQNKGPVIDIYMKGGEIKGNLFGGSNTSGAISELATVNVSGGTVTNVFGGGKGSSTSMSKGTAVNVSGGTINNNVYGGGEEGTVTGNTNVTVSGGTMKDVYGAGKGESAATGSKATVTGQTIVNVTGGTIANVYGGGENGNVVYAAGGSGSGSGDETITLNQNVTKAIESGKTYNFYDSGGANGQYDNSETFTATFTYDGDITISFTSFATEASSGCYNWDYMLIYDGTTSGTQIARGQTDCSSSTISSGSSFTATSGTMTIAWRSDGSQTAAGWAATITGSGSGQTAPVAASIVTINGGNISENVFGGGAYGTTDGNTIVNVKNGSVHGSVYGGALGEQGSVYVAGSHTVNVLGGRVYSNVYGGSRNANDALSFNPGTFANNDGTIVATNDETVCVVNISGGQIDQQVYAAGYYGNCFGSVYAFVGKNAIYNAPHHVETAGSESAGEEYTIAKLSITGSVWAGGDWGTFKDTFGAPTISGNSNVYVDAQDYITNTSDKNTVGYMGIDGSVYGSGTSCDAGNKEHTVMLRNYGRSSDPYNTATRDFASVQRADYLVLDNSHIHFLGQGRVNSLNVTEVYALYEVSEAVIVTGGSTLIMDAPVDQIKSFWSASCGNVYTAVLPTSQTATGGYTALTPTTLPNTPNKIRVNGGNYIKIYHDKQIATVSGDNISYTPGYGMLNGYAYMMASSGDNEATCAYARPRWCTDAPFEKNDGVYDNRDDGGWVSYLSGDNVFDLEGNKVTTGGVQMEYENHTPGSKLGEEYFRIWRTTGQISEREGVFDVVATGEDEFRWVDVEIELPAWRGRNYYFMVERDGVAPNYNSTIDYGTELMTFNTALYDDDSWITYDVSGKAQKLEANSDAQDEIKAQPNVNYGLVVMPGDGNSLSSPAIGGTAAPALIINGDSDDFLVKEGQNGPVNRFTFTENTEVPTVHFRLTYSDLLTSNKTYEPMYVNLVQCDENGGVKDIIKVKLIVNTSTTVGRNFKAQVYAVMNGNGSTAEESHVQVVLPRFTLNQGGVDSHFTVESIEWTPASTSDGNGQLVTVASGNFNKTNFAMEFSAADNYDGTTGWNELNYTVRDTRVVYDGQPNSVPAQMGTTSGRSQFSFDFNLYYNGSNKITVTQPELMGTIVYHMKFTNYGTTSTEYPNGSKDFTITIEVYRRGAGTRYYLDGVNGKNSNPGDTPDKAMLTLANIFNRSGFLPGDEIYVVNQVTAEDGLEWNGLAKGGNVLIYRYNGGHPLSETQVAVIDPETGEQETDPETGQPVYETVTGSIVGNPNNTAYTGALIEVPAGATMTILGITLDGYYQDGGDGSDYSTVTAEAPLINVSGTLELNQNVTLQQNYNINDGGAVYVYEGGTLMMNEDAHITKNKTEYNGGGVYMNGTMIVSDQVYVWDNIGDGNTQNNVYLASKSSMVQIGVDADSEQYQDLTYDAEDLAHSAKIGVTKPTSCFNGDLAEVVYSKVTDWLTEPLNTQAIIVHDGNIYKLETGASPNILYWRDTWVTFVTVQPEGFNINNIDSEEDLAWLISMVNGENGQDPHPYNGQTVVIKKDLDMQAHTWVPIGERSNVFKGTFEGNGYTIEGLNSSLNRTDLGMFGITEGATIQNFVAQCSFTGVANNYGTIAGTMKGGTISNVEAAGVLTGDATYAKTIGGLVGVAETGTTIHSCFAVNTITAQRDETVVGGLVANNGGDLINSYANVTITGTNNTPIGGLVGVNDGNVENCYVVLGTQTYPAFAATNNSSIKYCYADKQQTSYVGGGTDPEGSGYFDAVSTPHTYGYMYADNKVNASNTYVASALSYANNQIDRWPGLLSTLNYWVKQNSNDDVTYTSWLRPTSVNINGDLPVLTFTTGNALGTTDGKLLNYSVTSDTNNGLDDLMAFYGGKTSYIFLYGDATNVESLPGERTYVFINEDAALLQAQGSKANEANFINTTVGVTFDNSGKGLGNTDYYGGDLKYDWHLMATPLVNAPLGITYGDQNEHNYWGSSAHDNGQATAVENTYMPNTTRASMDADWAFGWDFYTYYEPQYHWINFKRNSLSHFHYDEPHVNIAYTNEENLIPGRGYMAAIDQDSYLSSTGTLNNGNVTIQLTADAPADDAPDGFFTYDRGSNLIGNPYQAYLDLTEMSKSVANGGTGYTKFYIYDAALNTYSPFVAGSSKNDVTAKTIHPHQGFFVVTDTETNPEPFTFKYTMATTRDADSYFRGNSIDYPVVNLFVNDEKGHRDLTIIELNRPELGGAEKINVMRNAKFKIAAHVQGKNYGLVFTPEGTERVPVHFKTIEDGTFTLTWGTHNGEFTSLILVDNLTGVRTDMLRNDHYTFNGSVDDYAARFYITYNVTDVNELNGNEEVFAYYDGNDWIVTGKGQLQVVDVTGRVLKSTYVNGDQVRLNLDGVAAGVYIMRLTDGKKSVSQKIVVK